MKQFHHIGLVTQDPKPGEMYFETLKVWGTDPAKDPNRIEWVRFKPESDLASTPVARMPHVSWQVDDLDAALRGKKVVVGPLTAAPGIRIAYFMMDGALVEYLEVK
jgi:hypothetical protein